MTNSDTISNSIQGSVFIVSILFIIPNVKTIGCLLRYFRLKLFNLEALKFLLMR